MKFDRNGFAQNYEDLCNSMNAIINNIDEFKNTSFDDCWDSPAGDFFKARLRELYDCADTLTGKYDNIKAYLVNVMEDYGSPGKRRTAR